MIHRGQARRSSKGVRLCVCSYGRLSKGLSIVCVLFLTAGRVGSRGAVRDHLARDTSQKRHWRWPLEMQLRLGPGLENKAIAHYLVPIIAAAMAPPSSTSASGLLLLEPPCLFTHARHFWLRVA